MQSIDTRKVQEEILRIIGKFGVNKTDLASYLGFTPQRLQYTLDTMVHLDISVVNKIYEFFTTKHISENQPGETKMISDQIIEHAILNNHQLALLTKTVRDMIADGEITNAERENSLKKIAAYRVEFNDSLNTLETLVKGSKELNHIYEMSR